MDKYGIIIRVPNIAIFARPGTNDFVKEILGKIEEETKIDISICRISFKEDFNSDTTYVRLVSTSPIEGLIYFSPFNDIMVKNLNLGERNV